MAQYIATTLAIGAILSAALSSKEEVDANKDMLKLQGKWKRVSYEREGKVMKIDDDPWLIIFENDICIDKDAVGKLACRSTIKLDTSKKPKTIDVTILENTLIKEAKGSKIYGIYEIDKDTLKMAYPYDGYKKRPTECATKKDSKHETYTYKKVK